MSALKPPPLSASDEARAKTLYRAWFKLYPNIANPIDINRQEKYEHLTSLGFYDAYLFVRARKGNLAVHGYPYTWTQPEYWNGGKPVKRDRTCRKVDEEIAKAGFEEWFSRFPDIDNPTDFNLAAKYNFAIEMGWEVFGMMQAARKKHSSSKNDLYPWTTMAYWQANKPTFSKS